MRKTQLCRLLPFAVVLAVGFALGGAFAVAGNDDAPVIDLTITDRVLDAEGTVVVEGGQGFVEFKEADGTRARVVVRGWNPTSKKSIVGVGSTVRVTGANEQGKHLEYRGHVTVLK